MHTAFYQPISLLLSKFQFRLFLFIAYNTENITAVLLWTAFNAVFIYVNQKNEAPLTLATAR